MKKSKKATVPLMEIVLKRHFRKQPLRDLVTASRTFPPTVQVDTPHRVRIKARTSCL